MSRNRLQNGCIFQQRWKDPGVASFYHGMRIVLASMGFGNNLTWINGITG
jgi:hypothetical protein